RTTLGVAVPHALQDRPTRAGGSPDRRRRRGLLPAAGLVAAGVTASWALLSGLPSLPGLPFGEDEVDRSTPVLLQSLTDLEEYHAATGTFQVVVDLERDTRWVPSVVSGERTTFLATGSVDAVVDLTALDSSAVQTSADGRRVVFVLPAARLDEADVDLERSRVLSRERGLLDRLGGVLADSPTSERRVAALAEDRLDQAAAESDLLRRAEENTRAMLTGMATSLGYDDVEVRFATTDPSAQ
ncbi:MAG: putative secreted protein, partial [Frankiales bacterium]|nr:putative secreted protein [Frankiales bacterium]